MASTIIIQIMGNDCCINKAKLKGSKNEENAIKNIVGSVGKSQGAVK